MGKGRYPAMAVFKNARGREIRQRINGNDLEELLEAAREREQEFDDSRTKLVTIELDRGPDRRPVLWGVSDSFPEGHFAARAEEFIDDYDSHLRQRRQS